MAIHDSIIGTGLAFPLFPDSSGRLAYVTGEDAIEQSLAVLLQTWLKERVMRPDFGSPLREQLFAPGSERSLRLLEQGVRAAIRDHEPRIEVDNIAATPDPRRSVATAPGSPDHRRADPPPFGFCVQMVGRHDAPTHRAEASCAQHHERTSPSGRCGVLAGAAHEVAQLLQIGLREGLRPVGEGVLVIRQQFGTPAFGLVQLQRIAGMAHLELGHGFAQRLGIDLAHQLADELDLPPATFHA